MTRAEREAMIARLPTADMRARVSRFSDNELRELFAEIDRQTAATAACVTIPDLGPGEERHFAILSPPNLERKA